MTTARQLFDQLLAAESEDEVINALTRAGYWDRPEVWRLYGDKEGNFAQAGNQQSRPEAALVEKIVNSVDARLMRACLTRGITPESSDAPQSVREAVAKFFGSESGKDQLAGTLANWGEKQRNEEARSITLAVTGAKPTRGEKQAGKRYPCLTVVDLGEGQTPARLPETILSLNAKNKQRVRFVQGKFNMGGTGALRFCGRQGLQLVLSKRDPSIVDASDSSDGVWGFTVVRRENPSNVAGTPVHSEFTYLAPMNADVKPRSGSVLTFRADELQVLPAGNKPYSEKMRWGTLIKLFEYELAISTGHALRKDGLLYALERLLPEIALPVRVHECREGYQGHEGSFDTTLAGLVTRLEAGKGDNLEPDFPISVQLRPAGMPMSARIYAFQPAAAGLYLRDEGVIFTVNGQAHGYLPKSLFARQAVGLPRLKDTLLVLVDCSELDAVSRENLFMSSRDRLSNHRSRKIVESEIEGLLHESKVLRELQQKRREAEVEATLSEDKPLQEVLEKVLKSSPTLRTLFLEGRRLSKPFARTQDSHDSKGGGEKAGEAAFHGKPHPSYFHFKGLSPGQTLSRSCELGRRIRIAFVTDVENGYFDRPASRGILAVEVLDGAEACEVSFSVTLENGEAHLSMSLPDGVEVGDQLVLQFSVSDDVISEPLVNMAKVAVAARVERPGGSPTNTKRKTAEGDKTGSGQEAGLAIPKIVRVREGDTHWVRLKFDSRVACAVESDPLEDGSPGMEHTFFVNLDNDSLKTEMKYARGKTRLLEAKFEYANVLLGLALLNGSETHGEGKDVGISESQDAETPQDLIRRFTAAAAPVLLPMIDQLSGLTEDDVLDVSEAGEDM